VKNFAGIVVEVVIGFDLDGIWDFFKWRYGILRRFERNFIRHHNFFLYKNLFLDLKY
jgi:hypothetical protein